MTTLHTRATARHRSDEDGFTLIELLVVVIILGVLAAIAIPSYLANVRKGNEAAVRSDVRSLAMTQFTSTLDGSKSYTTDFSDLRTRGWLPSIDNVTYAACTYTLDGSTEFVVGGKHSNGSVWVIASPNGGVVKGTDQDSLTNSVSATATGGCTPTTQSF